MRILIINADYPNFLRELYLSWPRLADSSYAEQMAARNHSLFGVADFYSLNFKAHGHEAAELHINNPWMQYAWAREHGLDLPPLVPPPQPDGAPARRRIGPKLIAVAKIVLRPFKPVLRRVLHRLQRLRRMAPMGSPAPDRHDWERAILKAQIEDFQPDVILNQEMAYLRSSFLNTVKKPGRLIIGQIASSLPEGESFEVYDLVISSLPNFVEWFRAQGVPAELNRLAFEPTALTRMGEPPPLRDIPLSFVGSLSPDHVNRIAFLEYLATRTPLKVWGNGIERLPASSPLHARYQGEAWGRDMYEILRRSRITLNFHIDLAEGWANNMRLYEATGMGPLLLTDAQRNLAEMFVPGEHVAAYTDAQDCVRQIELLLANDALRERIAAAGQRHAIATQNYFLRTGEIAALAAGLR